MTMQRRHFELIAELIGHYVPSMPHGVRVITQEQMNFIRLDLAKDFASALARTNPNFNRDRFLRACGVSDA